MPLVVNTNVSSLAAQRHLGSNTARLTKTMEKLASGYRINRAGDDAAGLQLSENLRAQIRGSKKAHDNVQDGINVLNIADGAYQTITDNLQRMRELAVQAGNDTYNVDQRGAIQLEINILYNEIDRIAVATEFNGVGLLDSTAPNTFLIQLGANAQLGVDNLDIASSIGDVTPVNFGLGLGDIMVDNSSNVRTALVSLDSYMSFIQQKRSTLGAFVNRLEGAANNLAIGIENLSTSESRIRNADIAAESASLIQAQILQQAANAMLAQANQSPNLALQLLQG